VLIECDSRNSGWQIDIAGLPPASADVRQRYDRSGLLELRSAMSVTEGEWDRGAIARPNLPQELAATFWAC